MATDLTTIKVSISDRERNFCEDESHRAASNRKELILITRENELDEEKPLDEAKLSALLKADPKKNETEIKMIELGGVKLTPGSIDLIGNCGAKQVACLRLYDCVGLTDEVAKMFGQRFGKSLTHLELVGSAATLTEEGVKALIYSIGRLEVLHLDNAISFLAKYNGTITNLRHVWSKVNGVEDLTSLSQFVVKYANYLRHLDITLSNTKDKTAEFVKLIGQLTGLTKLSITCTSNANIEAELVELLSKLGPNLTSLNLCVWCGGDATIEAIGKCTALEQLTLNGRSPMRHIDFRLEKPLAPLAKFGNTRIEGLDIDDAALANLSGQTNLAFLDLVSPLITESALANLIGKLPAITFLRINDLGSGGEFDTKVFMKALDAFAGEARKRQQTPMEIVFTETVKLDIESRRSMLPPNLTVSQKNSSHLVSFPGNTPRGF
ncbi:hypothetical protein BLOT_005095 [Blomia tropicalis]|nr:hypothetical protein BLOT_005095 [Blomia tropicalis]